MGGMGLLGLLPLVTRFKGGWIIAVLVIGFMLVGGIGGLGGMFGGSADDPSTTTTRSGAAPVTKTNDKKAQFVAFVLDDTQKTWKQELGKRGTTYTNAKLVMFTNATQTSCGAGQAAAGPFYCPNDSRVYIDLSFYDELEKRFKATGDFAQAYVIAHEIGHHVQHQLGISDKVHNASASKQKGEEGLSVRLELQADCFAGLWAHDAQKRDILEVGDIDEALNAAAAIGDDKMQKQAGGAVRPESWTHGSSAQRSRWFKTGYERGDMAACDTFQASAL